MKYTITPIRTTLRRGFGHLLGLRNDYLKGLSLFSKDLMRSLRYDTPSPSITIKTEEIATTGYPGIAKALEQKGIETISFTLVLRPYLPKWKTERIIAASVRTAIRHLATHGAKTGKEQGYLDYFLGEKRSLCNTITIEATDPSSPTVNFEVFEAKPLGQLF